MENSLPGTAFSETVASLERAGRFEELIELYESRAQEASDSRAAARELATAGLVASERWKNDARAEALLRRALALDNLAEVNGASRDLNEARRCLVEIYIRRGDLQSAAEVLERLAGALSSGSREEAGRAWMRAGELHEKLGRKERAVIAYQMAARADRQLREAYRAARRLLLAEGRSLSALESLERERRELFEQGEADRSSWRALADEAAAFAEGLINSPSEHELARAALNLAQELSLGHPAAGRIEAVLQGLDRTWRDRVRTLRAQSMETREPKAAARLSLHVARLTSWFDPEGGTAKVSEALDRCFLLWPAMPQALELLEQLAERGGDWTALESRLEKMALEARDRDAQVQLWIRLGTLRLERRGDAQGAAQAFARATESDPSRADAAGLAAELALEQSRYQDALEVWERHLGKVEDRWAQASLRFRLVELCLGPLKNRAAGAAHLEAILELDPFDSEAAFRLARLRIEDEDVVQANRWIELALHGRRSLEEKLALLDAATLVAEERGELRLAFIDAGRGLVLRPEQGARVSELEALAGKAGTETELAQLLVRVAASAGDRASPELLEAATRRQVGSADATVPPISSPSSEVNGATAHSPEGEGAPALAGTEALALDPLSRLEAEAKRLEGSAESPEVALGLFRKMLELSPDNPSVLKRMSGAHGVLGQWTSAAELTERVISVLPAGTERNEQRAKLAQIFVERLNRPEDGAAIFLELLLEGDERAEVVSGLEALASAGVRQTEISQMLAPYYARAGNHHRQVASLLVQLASAKEPGDQKALLMLLAETQEKNLLDSRAAFEFLLRAVAVDPADDPLQAEALRLARVLSAHVELARAFTDIAQREETPPKIASALLIDAARVAEEGGAIDDAARALEAALERTLNPLELVNRLADLYGRAKRPADEERALRRGLLHASPAEKGALCLKLADLNESMQRPLEAAEALQAAIAAGQPSDGTALEAEAGHYARLEDLLEQAGRSQELLQVLERHAAWAEKTGDSALASKVKLRATRVKELATGDRSESVRSYAALLQANPADAGALAALETLLEDPGSRLEAARALLPAYDAQKEYRKLVAVLEQLGTAASDRLEKVLSLRRAADLYLNQLKQPELAFAALARALHLAPEDAEIHLSARSAAEAGDCLDAYAEVLTDLLESTPSLASTPVEALVRRELADLFEKKLGDRARAVGHLRWLSERDPKNVEVLRALQRLLRAEETWGQLAETLEALAAVVTEPTEQVALWREAALLQEQRLGDVEKATQGWRQVAERDPLDRESALALDRLYTELGKAEELAFALELRRNQEGTGTAGREVAFRLAQLRREKLGDAPGALQLFRVILQEEPSHPGARKALEEWAVCGGAHSIEALEILDPALAATGEHAHRVRLREARAENADAAEQARLYGEVRAIYERDLGQPEMAFVAGLKAFSTGIDRASYAADLERLARRNGSYEELAEIFEDAARLLEAPDCSESDRETLLPLLRRAAEIREGLAQSEEATRLWGALLRQLPQDRQALDSLSKLYQRAKNAQSLCEVYSRKAQLTEDPLERRLLWLKAGQAYEEVGNDASAEQAYRTALALGPSDEALEALERLAGRARQFEVQAGLLLQRAELSGDADARKALLLRRAQLLEKNDQPLDAVRGYCAVLDLSPGEPQALAGLERLHTVDAVRHEVARVLEPIYRGRNDLKALIEVLETHLSVAKPEERLPLLSELASLREQTGQKTAALATRLSAFYERPQDAGAREALERLAADLGAFEELASGYHEQLRRGGTAPEVEELLWRRLAAIYSERLDRPDLAAQAWTEVAQRDPGDREALQQLGRVYKKSHAFRELAQVMRRQIALEVGVEGQVSLLLELAQLAEETLADKALAAEAYGAVLERKPEDSHALKSLGRVLSESERYEELAQLIGREIQLAQGKGAREQAFELSVRLGRLRLTRLGDPRGALETFKSVLAQRPAHPGAVGALEEMARSDNPLHGEAAAMLEPIFASGGDHLKRVQMLESRASAAATPKERAELYRRVARLYGQELNNPEMAFVSGVKALREVPDDAESLTLASQLAEAASSQEDLAALLVEIVERAVEDESRARLFRTLARLQYAAGEGVPASQSYSALLELLPGDSEALDRLVELLASQGKGTQLLEVLRQQLSAAEDPTLRCAVLLRISVLQETVLKDLAGAQASLRRLLELEPSNLVALERLERLCRQQQRWPELADLLARRLAALQSGTLGQPQAAATDLISMKYQLAELRELKLMDRFGALELFLEIVAADPSHPGALSRLEAWLEREPQNLQVSDALLAAYRSTNREGPLTAVLESRVMGSTDATERKAMLLELAALRERQQAPEFTYLALYRAFREDPNDAALRARMEAAAEAAKAHDELVTAYEETLPRIADAADASQICMTLGRIYDRRLGEPDRAAQAYEKARTLDSAAAPQALGALDRIYSDLDRPKELAAVLEAQVELTSDVAEKCGLLFRLGQLCQERLSDPERAIQAYEKILEIKSGDLAAARLLEPLYAAAGRHDKLYGALRLQRDLTQGPERERVLSRMAQVSAEGLSDVGNSIEIYRELLAKNPRNEAAFSSLETLLTQNGPAGGAELLELLTKRLVQTQEPKELIRLNDKVGRLLFRGLGRPQDAVFYFKAALERDPRHRGALEELRAILEESGDPEVTPELIGVLRRLLPLQDTNEGVREVRIGLAERLAVAGRKEEALDAARRALELEPVPSDQLRRIYQTFVQLKAFGDAVKTLESRAASELREEHRDAAIATWFEVVALWSGPAQKPENAASALEKILELDPANLDAYHQALELYQRNGDWRAHAQALERYLPHRATDEAKLQDLKEIARVQETKLGQKHVAFLAMCRALQLDPASDPTREEVERLAEETQSYEELAAVYEQIADSLPRAALAERLYLTQARVQDRELDDPVSAEAALRKVLEFDPTNVRALDAMAEMFSRRGKMSQYVAALEQRLDAAASIEERKGILREIGRVFAEKLENPKEAAAALHRAIEFSPDLETLQQLAQLYRAQKSWPEVIQSLLRIRELLPDTASQGRTQSEIAGIYERELSDDEAAAVAYRQAIEVDPLCREAVEALERIYTRLDRPDELLWVYERQLELTEDYRDRVKVLFKSAAIWEEKYRSLENADACVEGVLALDPQNLQAIKTLERLRREQGRFEELVQVYERHLQLVTLPEEQASLCVEVGDVLHQELKQVDRAVNAYHHALELDPSSRAAMHALGMLYERSGNWPFALEMLQREAEVLGEGSGSVELLYRIGKINEEMLQDAQAAKSAYQEALQRDPAYLPVLRALKGIYLAEQSWPAYEEMVLAEAGAAVEPESRAQALIEAARYFEEVREDRETARNRYEEAHRLMPEASEIAAPLSDIYLGQEQWEGAERMLEVVVRNMSRALAQSQDEQLARDLCRQLYRLGYVTEKLGKREVALGHYEKAYGLDATYLPAQEGLGNLLVQSARLDEALKVYQTILLHHREDLTDLEVVEIYWQLGEIHHRLRQPEKAQNHFEKALTLDASHEPSLRALVQLADEASRFDRAVEYRQSLLRLLEGEAKHPVYVELGKLARDKLADRHTAIDAFVGALKVKPDDEEVADALYVLYRETQQSAKAAQVLEVLTQMPSVRADREKLKRVAFALGELARDELRDLPQATAAFNAALDADYRFVEAFSALEAMLGGAKRWRELEENYTRMIQRLPKQASGEGHGARMALWKALGDLHLNVLKDGDAALLAYQVVSAGMPDNPQVQETYAELAASKPGQEEQAIAAYRRALPNTARPTQVASALAELSARRKDYDSAYLAAQVVQGLRGTHEELGAGEKEILRKLAPYAKKKEVAQRPLTDRLWVSHLFHPKVRSPVAEIMAILYEQVGHLYSAPFAHYQLNPKKHRIDVASAQEYQLHHYRYVARLLGMEAVELYSPFLVATRERLAKRSNEPAPEPTLGIELCHTQPVCLKVGGKFFSEGGQKESYYAIGRAMALIRPELALSQRLAPERLEAVFQATVSLASPAFAVSADPAAVAAEARLLDQKLSDPARVALQRVVKAYLKSASPADVRTYLEGAELTAVRTGLFVAGEIEPVKKMIQGESGTAYRVPTRSKLRDMVVFALSEDLHALREAVGTHVEVKIGAGG